MPALYVYRGADSHMNTTQNHGTNDPWLLPDDIVAAQNRRDQTVVEVESIESVYPLGPQVGAFPKQMVPDALHQVLFGRREPRDIQTEAASEDFVAGRKMRTYAVLDASKATNLPELLERSGLEHRCLFKGPAFEELKNVAPWIVLLEDNNAFTRHLFTRSKANWHLWDEEPGIYVRSYAALDDLWRHFRKFTRIQDEGRKWHFFKFWEPRITYKLPVHQSSRELLIHMLSGCRSMTIICSDQRRNKAITMEARYRHGSFPRQNLVLTSDAKAALTEITHENAQEDLAWSVAAQSGNGFEYEQVLKGVRQRWNWLQGYGMTELPALKQGSAALLRLSADQISRHDDVQAIVTAPRIGDAMKARLIERVVSA